MTKKKEKIYDKGQPKVFDAFTEKFGFTEDDLIIEKVANRATTPFNEKELLEKPENNQRQLNQNQNWNRIGKIKDWDDR